MIRTTEHIVLRIDMPQIEEDIGGTTIANELVQL